VVGTKPLRGSLEGLNEFDSISIFQRFGILKLEVRHQNSAPLHQHKIYHKSILQAKRIGIFRKWRCKNYNVKLIYSLCLCVCWHGCIYIGNIGIEFAANLNSAIHCHFYEEAIGSGQRPILKFTPSPQG
jgi:hypothetical protein